MAKENKVETVETTDVENTVETAVTTKSGPTQYMYVGPNLFTRGILQYQVFIDELPSEVNAFAEEREQDIKKLIIPVDGTIGEIIKEVNTSGTLLNIYYKKVQDAYGWEVNEHGI